MNILLEEIKKYIETNKDDNIKRFYNKKFNYKILENPKKVIKVINYVTSEIDKERNNKSLDEIKKDLLHKLTLLVDEKYIKYLLEFIFNNYNYKLSESSSDDELCDYESCDDDDYELLDIYTDKVFEFKENQLLGIKSAIDNNFSTGIHSQATGSGKSIMALKIISEYNIKYPKDNIMWLCERKDIMQKLFFKIEGEKKKIVRKHQENYNFWKKNDIIDMGIFEIIELVHTRKKNWLDIINKKYIKPLFIIINRAYLTTSSKTINNTYKYEDITMNIPKLIIKDECHSAMAPRTYELLLYCKYNWKANIQGLSATPYRRGKASGIININIDTDTDINLIQNEQKLLKIFSKPGNENCLNILSWFNLKEAIETGAILEPVFHWFSITKYKSRNKEDIIYHPKEIASTMAVINSTLDNCHYKKCLVWCKEIDVAENWKKIFLKEQKKYDNLCNMTVYIDHSKRKSTDYDNFYDIKDKAIMFCANKFREGSDIPYLSCCMFLDRVKNRGELPFIQCIGRVLRKDEEKLKSNGHILDCCVNDDTNKEITIVNKILKYYLQLYEISKSDIEGVTVKDIPVNKLKLYDEILNSLDINPDKKEIKIMLKNDKNITINIDKIDIKSFKWNKIIHKFERVLKRELIMSEYEEYLVLKKKVKDFNIGDKYEYIKKWKEYKLFNDEGIMIDPEKRFPEHFKNWYEFLGIDTSKFIQTKDEWKRKCLKLSINSNSYYKEVKKIHSLPTMPESFYIDFTSLPNEFNEFPEKRRDTSFNINGR